MKISKEDQRFNRGVFMGLIGGLFVIWSQIGIKEIIRIFDLPDHYLFQLFGTLIIAIFLFVIFAVTQPLLKRLTNKK